jgi:hypothetical protein
MNGENGIINDDEIDGQMQGGRRHRGSKKRHSKRRGNASLRAWVTFVKKVQREEKVSYKEAMMRAKKRKDNGEKWRGGALTGGEDDTIVDDEAAIVDDEANLDMDEADLDEDLDMEGGRRRRRRRTRKHRSRKSRGRKSRRHR